MKRLAILFAFALALPTLWAQNPGFLGRHFAVTLNGNLAPDYCGIILDKPNSELLHYVHVVPEVTMEYTLKENRSLFVSGRVIDGLAKMDCDPFTTSWGDCYWETALLPMKTYTAVLGVRGYFDDMAPLGTFYGVGVVYNRMAYDFDASSHAWRYSDEEMIRSMFGLQLDLGRKYIFREIALLEIGVRYGVTFAYPFAETFDFNEAGPFHSVAANNWLSNIFALRLGVGLLPF